MELQKSLKDIVSGLIFAGFGALFAVTALTYPMGSATRMGAGFFPFALGVILVAFGVVITIKGFAARGEREDLGPIPWRGVVFVLGALVFFGFCVRGLGLIPTLFVTVFVTAMASRMVSVVTALLLAAGMSVLCYLIFIVGLDVTVPVVGPWLTF